MNIAEVAVLWVGGNRVGVHAMQIGSISAVLEYAILILFFVMMAQMVILTLPRAAACLNRAQQVLEIEPSIVDGKVTLGDGAPESADGADAVAVFDHMSFRFDDADEDTLCNLSFTCRRGQTTAIVGSTGSGKSTVAKLLLRFHDATKGAIRLDGVDLRELSQGEIRGRIAYVPQKAWLFSGTVQAICALAMKTQLRPTCFMRSRLPRAPLCSISRRGSIRRYPRAARTFRAVSASVWQSPVRS